MDYYVTKNAIQEAAEERRWQEWEEKTAFGEGEKLKYWGEKKYWGNITNIDGKAQIFERESFLLYINENWVEEQWELKNKIKYCYLLLFGKKISSNFEILSRWLLPMLTFNRCQRWQANRASEEPVRVELRWRFHHKSSSCLNFSSTCLNFSSTCLHFLFFNIFFV